MTLEATSFIMIYMLTLLLVATEMVPMSIAALIGALLSVWIGISYGVFSYEQASSFVDIRLLGLLIGTMIVMEVAYRSGLFRFFALYAIRIAGGDPKRLFVLICLTSAVVSMFLSDSTALLLLAAAATTMSKIMDYDPVPYFVSASIMVNLGGTSTFIGSVSNMIIGLSSGLSFADFLNFLFPCELALWVITTVTLYFLYRSRLPEKKEVPEYDPWEGVKDKSLLKRSALLLVLFVALFVLQDQIGVGPEAIALSCAILALAISNIDPGEIFGSIDWETIFFLAGLFFIVGGLEKTGILNDLSQAILGFGKGDTFVLSSLTLWLSGLTSAIVSNIAVALTFIPVVNGLKILNLGAVWSSLVLGSNLGGAATPISGVVTVMAIGALKKDGTKFNLAEFTKAGLITTFIQLLFANIYLVLRFGL